MGTQKKSNEPWDTLMRWWDFSFGIMVLGWSIFLTCLIIGAVFGIE
jgi:hypothetical protein